MSLRKKLIVLGFVFAMIATACGDSTEDTTAAPTTAAPGTTAAPTTAAPTTAAPTTTVAPPAEEIMTDIGVSDTEIRIGLLADLSGPFSGLTVDIVDAQVAYWEDVVNANGGIAGRNVVPVIEDTGYNVATHGEKYTKIVDEVVAFSNSTGSPHTASILSQLKEDNVLAMPLSWYSGWADPAFDSGLTFELGTNYCIEGMNVIEWMVEKFKADNDGALPTLAVVTRAGDYGQDAAAGVKYAAQQLGLDIVYDGEGLIVRSNPLEYTAADAAPVIPGIVGSSPDIVWVTGSGSETAVLLGGSAQAGLLTAQWTGSTPSYDFRLLDSAAAEAFAGFFFQSNYAVSWGTDVPGMAQVSEVLTARYPDRRPSDAFILGWTEARAMEQILRQAAANGDLTRQGVIDAANSVELISMGGAAPDQNYVGSPNDYVVRETYIYKPDLVAYLAAGGAEQQLQNGLGTTGSTLIEGPFVMPLAANFEFTGACWTQEEGNRISG